MSDLRYLVSCTDWAGRERVAAVQRVDDQVVLVLPAGESARFTPRQLAQLRRVLSAVTSPDATVRSLAQRPGGAGTAGVGRASSPAVSGSPLDVPLWTAS